MNTTGAQIKWVLRELLHNSRYPFEKSCIDLLRFVNPELIDSKELGHFEREGIDAYSYDIESKLYLKAFQFKGFEVMEFGVNQEKQCLKSIDCFSKSKKVFKEYYLISNLPIKNKFIRNEIEKEIRDKIKVKTQKAYLLDVNQFLKLLMKEYNNLIKLKIENYNNRIISQYQKTVEQQFYYQEVPFLDNSSGKGSNPKIHLFNKSYNLKTKEFELSKWRFILSEFGFGKTSLLQNLMNDFKSARVNTIFLPVSSMSSNGLSSTTNICKEIAELIFESKPDFEYNLSQKIIFTSIKNIISSTNRMVIIFDGLDEHNFAYKFTGLKHIFTSFKEITAPIFISMRKEFWLERQEEIKSVLGKATENVSIVELVEWEDSNVLEFLNHFQANSGSSSKLDWFKELVEQNNYKAFFGDIPKRPLFLKMLLIDLKNGSDATNSISMLYWNYFFEKFKIDLEGYIGNPSRPLSVAGGIVTQAKSIVSILKQIAIKMIYSNEKPNALLQEFINENDILDILNEGKVSDVLEILMHSVLMPFGSKEYRGFKLRFAHKSYQEYFTASYLFEEIIIKKKRTLECELLYPETIITFIISMIKDQNIDNSELTNAGLSPLINQILEKKAGS